MSKYNVGDKVRIVNERGFGWNFDGEMDEYRGKVLTVSKVECPTWDGNALYTMEECPIWAWSNEDIAELVYSSTTNPVNTTNTTTDEETEMKTETTTTNKVALPDAPMEFSLEMARITSEFTDNILKLADKFNTDRRETMGLVAKTITHTSEDDFFWDFIVPMQDILGKCAK